MITILSWNILQGGGSRLSGITEHIIKLSPTICVLSEFRNNNSGYQLRSLLLKAGYRYQFVTAALQDDNSVIVLSKLPCNSYLHKKSDPLFSANILSVQFEVFTIMGVYLPHKKKHTLFNYIQDLVATDPIPYIITGDFNTGINHVDQQGNSFWYENEFKNFAKIGYKDAFRYLWADKKEYSWYSHEGNGYRYDHTIIHENLLPILKECYYRHTWRDEKMSDHSPMYIRLG